ncbi:hypothetical protein FBY31_2960 [Arthrobacter sp. SLBN-100]|nr:hypothetical protein FBY31_2960 [Arthrobacter sp. SLBN-100]
MCTAKAPPLRGFPCKHVDDRDHLTALHTAARVAGASDSHLMRPAVREG